MLSLRLFKEFRRAAVPFRLDLAYEIGDEHKSLVLFGPSGSGKTLTMQAIAGLIRPDAGHIRACGRTLYDGAAGLFVPARKRRIGYMFQDYALFPHLSLLQNTAYARSGILSRFVPARERDRALAMLERFGIGHLAGH